MKILQYYIFVVFVFIWSTSFHVMADKQLVLTIPEARSELDISHDYHKTLLIMALRASNEDREVILQERPFRNESRVIAEIKKHQLVDVYWLGADVELEKAMNVIPVPTTKGLIGFRKFIIRQESVEKFDEINNAQQLSKLIACQGESWPDTRILRNADFRVTTAQKYEDLFRMLAAKRCDYFPRGLHDHTKELELRQKQYPQFVSYQNILMHYPFGVFFYVSKQADELAKDLTRGMQLLAEQGEIVRLMKTHPLTRHVFPLNSNEELKLFTLPNPYLGSNMNPDDNSLWLQPQDFHIPSTSGYNSK